MIAIIGILVPIFGLIALGYAAGLKNWFGHGATDCLNRFVVRVALPAQLFMATAQTPGHVLLQPGLLIVFGTGCLLTALLGWVFDWMRPTERDHRMSGAAIEGLCAGYSNTAFIGIPVCLAVFGPGSMAAVTIASLLTVCLLFAIAIALVEFENAGADPAAQRSAAQVLGQVALGLLRNPLVFMPLAGGVLNASGIGLAGPFAATAQLIGSASSPCALVTIGLFLADTRPGSARSAVRRVPPMAVARLVTLKLLVQPGVTAMTALAVKMLDRTTFEEAVLLAALPTGTGPFMLAKLYDREAGVASRAILISTLLSAVTIAALLRASG